MASSLELSGLRVIHFVNNYCSLSLLGSGDTAVSKGDGPSNCRVYMRVRGRNCQPVHVYNFREGYSV